MTGAVRKTVRCAIYTRVSTEAGLDQGFNSLDAQYEAARAYIPYGQKIETAEGWPFGDVRCERADAPEVER